MIRADGLVQRRTTAQVQAAQAAGAGAGSSAAGRHPEPDDDNGSQSESDLTNDSKDTRLTLMEEVLLLGLKDKEVSDNPVSAVY